MRTTVRLDEDLMQQVRQYAARNNRTLTSVMEDSLRQLLERERRDVDGPRVDIIVFTGDGLQAGIDLDDRSTWAELAEAEDAEHFQAVDHVDA